MQTRWQIHQCKKIDKICDGDGSDIAECCNQRAFEGEQSGFVGRHRRFGVVEVDEVAECVGLRGEIDGHEFFVQPRPN